MTHAKQSCGISSFSLNENCFRVLNKLSVYNRCWYAWFNIPMQHMVYDGCCSGRLWFNLDQLGSLLCTDMAQHTSLQWNFTTVAGILSRDLGIDSLTPKPLSHHGGYNSTECKNMLYFNKLLQNRFTICLLLCSHS